jgi:predicted Zn-dependent protease
MTMRVLSLLCLVCLLAALLAGCGGHVISRSQEIQMGRQSADQFERENGGRDRDSALNAEIQQIASRIVPAAQPPDYPYDVRVLANKQVNACAFPGGRIYVFRGLIDTFGRNRDEIAWVMGHETAHVARQHAVKLIDRQLGYEAVISLLLNKGDAPQIAGAVANLMLLGYSRTEESEADRYGLIYSHAAGYDPTASLAVLKKFQELQGREPSNFEIMFATHPGDNTRINDVQGYLKAQGWGGAYYRPG